MRIFISDSTNVYFNLATEDYFLNHTNEDILFFWRSEKAIVCGKHQNICAEANYAFCKENNILLARRLSGGGTVYHDLGNVNFTFIQNLNSNLEKAIDFPFFLKQIAAALREFGIHCELSSRNDLLLNGKKISGNAQHIIQKKLRVIHHGTLLLNADLSNLGNALKAQGKYESHAVKSVRSSVMNIFEEIQIPILEWMHSLKDYFISVKKYQEIGLTSEEKMSIANLNKYKNYDWIVGYSPPYHAYKEIQSEKGVFQFEYTVKNLEAELHTVMLNAKKIEIPQFFQRFVLIEERVEQLFNYLELKELPHLFY